MADFYSEEDKKNNGLDGGETAAQPPSPAEPKVLKPEEVTASGDSNLSFYGSKARAVNQKTGAETWYDVDANGGLTERKDAPASMQIAANGGIAPDDTMRKFEKYNRMKSEEKAKARAGYNKVIADTLSGALDQVYRNETIREHNGQKYRVGTVDADALAGANTQLGKLGKNTVKQIFAMQQVAQTDSNQMLGEPQFVVEFNKDGVTKSDGKRIARIFTRSQIENIIRKSYEATGEASRGEDVIKALFRDRAGEIKAEKEKEEAKRLADAKMAEERRKQLESEALARAKVLNDRFGLDTERIKVLGGVSADFAKEHPDKGAWLRDMFSDPNKAEVFSRTNEQEVDADGNPVTDDKGMPVYKTLSPEEAVKKAGEFYDVASGGGATNPYMSYIDAMLGKGGAGAGETVTEPKAEGTQGVGMEPKTEGTQGVGTDINAIKEKLKAALARKKAEQQTQGTGQPAPQPQAQQPVAPVEPSASAPAATVQQVEKPQQPATTQTADYGLRNDGKTYKGTGWLGELKTADGGVATEYTVGVNIGGKEMDIPTLVPTLTKDEVDLMVNDIIPNKKPVPDAIMQKAADHAKMRLENGQSVFANDGQPTAEDTPSIRQGQFVLPNDRMKAKREEEEARKREERKRIDRILGIKRK